MTGVFDVSGVVDKSLCSQRAIAVTVGSVVYMVPREGDTRRWVTWNVPEAFWDRVTRAVEEFERWEEATSDERE